MKKKIIGFLGILMLFGISVFAENKSRWDPLSPGTNGDYLSIF